MRWGTYVRDGASDSRRSVPDAQEAWALRAVLVCTAAGGVIAAYPLKLHAAIAGTATRGLCTSNDTLSCDKVLASAYAEIAGIPVALVGLLGFGLLFGLAAWRLRQGSGSPRWLPSALALAAGAGLLFELGMTWIEVFVIRALCPYCLTAFALLTASFVAAVLASRAGCRQVGREAERETEGDGA